jgi:hypothetical protein
MTIGIERSNSLKHTRQFLMELLNPKMTPKVPKDVRMAASYCLRHFPSDLDIEQVQELLPETWGDLPFVANMVESKRKKK